MISWIFFWLLVIFIYLMVGVVVYQVALKEYFVDVYVLNPLWKLPIYLFYPISVFLVMVINLFTLIYDYIKEICDYYRKKKNLNSNNKKYNYLNDLIEDKTENIMQDYNHTNITVHHNKL